MKFKKKYIIDLSICPFCSQPSLCRLHEFHPADGSVFIASAFFSVQNLEDVTLLIYMIFGMLCTTLIITDDLIYVYKLFWCHALQLCKWQNKDLSFLGCALVYGSMDILPLPYLLIFLALFIGKFFFLIHCYDTYWMDLILQPHTKHQII